MRRPLLAFALLALLVVLAGRWLGRGQKSALVLHTQDDLAATGSGVPTPVAVEESSVAGSSRDERRPVPIEPDPRAAAEETLVVRVVTETGGLEDAERVPHVAFQLMAHSPLESGMVDPTQFFRARKIAVWHETEIIATGRTGANGEAFVQLALTDALSDERLSLRWRVVEPRYQERLGAGRLALEKGQPPTLRVRPTVGATARGRVVTSKVARCSPASSFSTGARPAARCDLRP